MQTRHPLRTLADISPLRVWSVIITIFGDAVAPRGGAVPAVVLQAILENLEIKPEAMRVALHRLVKDGWITRSKVGRQSHYRLTATGETEFLAARKRIYAKEPALKDPWKIAVLPGLAEEERATQGNALSAAGYTQIGPTLYLGDQATAAADPPAFAISGTVDALPDWVQQAITPKALCDDFARLEAALTELDIGALTSPPVTASARILIVHQWRRLLLRHPDLPAAWMPEGWRGEACRALVLDLHHGLSKTADPWLDQEIGDRALSGL